VVGRIERMHPRRVPSRPAILASAKWAARNLSKI
jgi:hypothetical protein